MQVSAVEFHKGYNEMCRKKLAKVSGKIRLFAWYRLLAFALIIVPFILWGWSGWLTLVPSLIFFLLFLFLVKKNTEFEKQKSHHEILVKLTSDELLALDGRFAHFDDGASFLNPAHFNSYDLDLFGEGSVFQYINRTSTQSGQQVLADWIQNPLIDKEEIEKRQQAVGELIGKPEWILKFRANGHAFQESSELSKEIRNWSDTDFEIKHPAITRWMLAVLPALTILAGIFAVSGGTRLWFVFFLLVQWLLLYLSRKEVSRAYAYFGRKSALLEKYMQLVELIEKQNFSAPLLQELQKKVLKPYTASYIFRQLKKYVNQFDYRQNIVVNILFNSLFLWEIRCTYKLWKWHRRNRKKLAVWLDIIATTDAFISVANLAYNHPEFKFPEIHEGGFTLSAKKMGHPLIPGHKRINNDLYINGWGKVVIITGANMAGKSTFLRTVGVNLILGQIGAPVCAEMIKFTPVKIFTNMRTTDSLLKDESYFFAELKRIKDILDRLKNGERIFVILDEMLKGTNSVDKLNGSKELIKKLLELKAVALIATHDLKISELEEEFPQMIFNKCFEIKLDNEDMVFDYLLKEGVTKTMNATFLMKKMGII